MRPGIRRIDGDDQLAEQPLDPSEVAALRVGCEGKSVVGAEDTVDEVVRRRASDRRVRRVERETELLDEAEVRGVRLPDQLAAELNGSSVVDGDLLDSAAHTIARLEHENVRTTQEEIARGRQPGEACSHDDDVAHPLAASSSARILSASAGR